MLTNLAELVGVQALLLPSGRGWRQRCKRSHFSFFFELNAAAIARRGRGVLPLERQLLCFAVLLLVIGVVSDLNRASGVGERAAYWKGLLDGCVRGVRYFALAVLRAAIERGSDHVELILRAAKVLDCQLRVFA